MRGFAPGFVKYAVACDKVYQLLARGRWFSLGTPVSSTTKTGRHFSNSSIKGCDQLVHLMLPVHHQWQSFFILKVCYLPIRKAGPLSIPLRTFYEDKPESSYTARY
jgi:predicted phosphoadenosine phosphosulfate sulfurtransferase